MTFYHIFYMYRGMLLVNSGAALFCFKFHRRKFFWLTLFVGLALNFVFTFFQNEWLRQIGYDNELLTSLLYFAQWLITFLIIFASFDCKLISAVFCTTIGYSLQQLVMRLSGLVSCYASGSLIALLTTLIFGILVYALVFFIFNRRSGKGNAEFTINSPTQLIIMTLVLIVMIPIEHVMIPFIFDITNDNIRAVNFLSSAIFSVLAILLEFNLLLKEDYRKELDVVKQISLKEQEQYQTEKLVIDTINIKCHDLKHQLAALDGKVDEDEIDKIKKAVDVYDTAFKTGNRAVDVVLTTKSLVCKAKSIELTCMIDGKSLSFMKNADVYSLFGNILDNAIEAVEKIDDVSKRVISITSSVKDGLMFIHQENYVLGSTEQDDGIIETTKQDKVYHGFGMRSIKMITSNYGGDFHFHLKNGIFALDLMFFINSEAKNN